MTTAKNREHYIAAWTAHINALVDMFTTSDAEYGEWSKARSGLMNALDSAANNAFPEATMTGDLPTKEAK